MSNEFLWVLELIGIFTLVVFIYRKFGVVGLYGWVAVVAIIANIQVQKLVTIFGMTTALGSVLYASSFLATDILCEYHGKKSAQKLILFGFVVMIAANFLLFITLQFSPAEPDTAHPALFQLFSVFPRITLASLVAYGIAQFHDVWAFMFWKRLFPKQLWVRNNFSTIVSQAMDTVIFYCIAFLGVFPFAVIVSLILTRYLLKIITSVCDTLWIYLLKRWKPVQSSTQGE